MTTDKLDNECFNIETLRDIVGTNSTTDRHYDCAATGIVPERGGGARDGLRDDGHGLGGGKRAQRPVGAQNEALLSELDAVLESDLDLQDKVLEAERLRQVECRAHYDAYPEARGATRHQFQSQGFFPRCGVCNGKRDSPYHYDAESFSAQTDANATLNLLRDLEQRVQLAHQCEDGERIHLMLLAIKGILNGAIAEREEPR